MYLGLDSLDERWPNNNNNNNSTTLSSFENNSSKQCPKRNLGIIGEDPSASKSTRLHVCDLLIFLYQFEVYSIDLSKMMGFFSKVLNWKRLFLKLNKFHL